MHIPRTLRISALALAASLAFAAPSFAQTLPAIFAGKQQGDGIYIDAGFLDQLSARNGVKLIDIRTPEAYAAGHLPGAISIPNDRLSITEGELRNQLPPIADRQALFAAAGLSYDDTIVIYGDDLAGRSYLAFDQSGFENVHVLEGGFPEWKGAVTTAAANPSPSNFVLDRDKIEIVDKDYVLAHLDAQGVFIIDSRGADSYDKGSIPGSYNIPVGLTHAGASLNPVDDLVAALQAIGVTKDKELILTCGSGNVASNQLAVLRDLGYRNLKLYDGSWGEWGSDPSTPKQSKAKL